MPSDSDFQPDPDATSEFGGETVSDRDREDDPITPLVELIPEPVRTAAEILGLGFWSYSSGTLEVSERALHLLDPLSAESLPKSFVDEITPSDAEIWKERISKGVRFEIEVRAKSGAKILITGWPEDGIRARFVGTITSGGTETDQQPVGSQDSLLVEAIEKGVESMLVLRAVSGAESRPVDFEVVEVNSRAATMLGCERGDAVGKLLSQLIPETRDNGVIHDYIAVMSQSQTKEREFHASPGGFQQIWIKQRIVPLSDGLAIFSQDVTQSRRSGEAVDRAKRMFERIAATTPDLILLWDAYTRRFVYSNRALDSLAGSAAIKSMSELAGKMQWEDQNKLEEYLTKLSSVDDEASMEGTFRFRRPGNALAHFLFRTSPFERAANGAVQLFMTTAQDVTLQVSQTTALQDQMNEVARAQAELEERQKQLQELNLQLSDLASTDALTGIKNRRAFQEKLDEEVERAQRYNSRLALLLADVDNFKTYNDQHGHPAGDQALKGFAQVLSEVCRRSDTVARYGGEEFAVILPNTGAEEASRLGDRIRASLSGTLFGRQGVTASIGCSEYSAGKDGKEKLVSEADKALYESKNSGKDRVTIFKG